MVLRVAILLPSLANKAPVQVAKDLTVGMIALGINVEVFYFDEIVEVDFPCRHQRLNFFDRLEFERFDVVHAHMLRPDAYIWFWNLFGRSSKTIFVSTIHNIVEVDLFFQYGRVISFVFSRLWRLFWSRHDLLVVLNQDARKYYHRFLRGRDVVVIRNGRALSLPASIDPIDETIIRDLKSSYKLIGCCALLTHRKGIDQVINILPKCEGYALVVVGDGKDVAELEVLAANLGVSNRCKFLGFRHNAQSYLSLFDVYAMPSRSEGLPLALLEAAGNGLAIVCSNIAPFREVFTPEEVSFFDLEDEDDLIRAIDFAYVNRVKFSKKVYAKYCACYTSEIMTNNYVNLFKKMIL